MVQGSTQISHSQVKNCDRQLETKNLLNKARNRKTKKTTFFSHVPRITQPKNYVPRPKSVSCSRQTDGQTHTKVTTEGTLLGFQDFFLKPIIKDRPNNKNSFQTLGGKIWPLALILPVTFVPGSVRCSSALCLFPSSSLYTGCFSEMYTR